MMIPWSFLVNIGNTTHQHCKGRVRIMYGAPISAEDPSVIGIHFHEPDHLTVQLNETQRSSIRLSMLAVLGSAAVMLNLEDTRSKKEQRVIIWRDLFDRLNASISHSTVGQKLPEFAHHVHRLCRVCNVTYATRGVPKYLLVVTAKVDGQRRRYAYYTSTCVSSVESEWALSHFQSVYPDTAAVVKKTDFHTAFDIQEFTRQAQAEQWWVYLNGEPKLVNTREAESLLDEKQITHVCVPGSVDWRTREQVHI